MYELVIFDMDGTLYEYEDKGANGVYGTRFHGEIRKRAAEFVSKKLNMNLREATDVVKAVVKKYEGSVSIGLQKEYGLRRSEYISYVWDIDAIKYIKPDPRLRAFMSSIPIKKVLLTASPAIWAKKALKRLGVDDLFDEMWFGDDDIRKPLKEAYLRAMSSLKVKPENTIIVEDETRYLKPAKEVGIATVLIGSDREPYIDHNVSSIYESKKLILKDKG